MDGMDVEEGGGGREKAKYMKMFVSFAEESREGIGDAL